MKIRYETISLFVIFLLVLKAMLINSTFIPLPSAIEYAIEIVSFAYIAFINLNKYAKSKKKLLIFFFLSICTLYTGLVTNQLVIFSSFLVLCLAQTIEDKDKIVKVIFKTLLIILFIHFIYFILQKNFSLTSDRTIRYSLGFEHFNTSSVYALWCFCAYSYLNKNKKNKIILGQLLLIIIYLFTKTRTMIICSFILTIIYLLAEKRYIKKIVNLISKNIVLVVVILLYLLIFMHSNNILPTFINKIDQLVSYRLSFSVLALEEYGITIIGQKYDINSLPQLYINNSNLGDLTVDVTYIGFLYSYGAMYILLIILITRSIAKSNKNT